MPATKRLKIEERMLSEIADSIIALLINESEESLEKIKGAVKQAGIKYNGEEYNWLISSILTYWRSRKSETKNTERDINHYTDVLTRLKAFSNVFLNPDGAWESTSYNTMLILHLLGAIDDEPDPCDKAFYSHIASKLAVPFKLKLQEWVHQYEYDQKMAEAKARSLKTMSDKTIEATLSAIKLFAGNQEASHYARKNPDQAVFRLYQKEKQWHLLWYDLLGEKNALDVSDDLKALLSRSSSDSSYLNNADVKSECLKLRDVLIEGRKVLINPPASEMTDLRTVFVLKKAKNDYALDWYDSDGLCRPIDLKKYPDFVELLETVDSIDEQNKQQIERHLRRVNVLTKTEIKSHIKRLDNFFKFKGAESAPTYQLMVNPASHQLAGLESTFILYKKDESLRLEWYDAFGKGQEIDIAAYPAVNDWIKARDEIVKEDYPELKQLLAKIDTSKAMDRSEFKAQLKACLENSLHKEASDPRPAPEKKEGVKPGKLNVNEFAVARLFGHKEKPAALEPDAQNEISGPKM